MRAMFTDQSVFSLLVAENNQFFVQNLNWSDGRLFGKLSHRGDRVPVTPQQFSARSTTPDAGQEFVFFARQHVNSAPILSRRRRQR